VAAVQVLMVFGVDPVIGRQELALLAFSANNGDKETYAQSSHRCASGAYLQRG
jgi:hypothetical protein